MNNKGTPGINSLAGILSGRMKQENKSAEVLDFGKINPDYSLQTNTFPIPIPKTDYTVLRCAAYGEADAVIGETSEESSPGSHKHDVLLPKNMKSICPGDSVLVAWVGNDAVVIDIILPAAGI